MTSAVQRHVASLFSEDLHFNSADKDKWAQDRKHKPPLVMLAMTRATLSDIRVSFQLALSIPNSTAKTFQFVFSY